MHLLIGSIFRHDMMRGLSLDINQLLGKVKYLFVAIIVFLFVVELTMSILRSLLLFPTATMLLVHAIVYMATCTAFAIFFFVTAGRLLKTMAAREAPEKRKSKKANLKRVSIISLNSAFSLYFKALCYDYLIKRHS